MNADNFTLSQDPPALISEAASFGILECNRLYANVHYFLNSALVQGVLLGYHLIKVKEELPHGVFKKLFKKDSKSEPRFAFGDRMAQKYMKLCNLLSEKFKDTGFEMMLRAGSAEGLIKFFKENLPDILSVRAALLMLDDGKTVDPKQFETDKAEHEEPSDEERAILYQREFSQMLMSVQTFIGERARTISVDNRRMLANQLAQMADELLTLD